jgi:molecular chaperone HtpG
LLRFESSAFPKGQRTSLADYSKRLKEDQKEIHFILAPNRDAAESSPYFEVFQSKNYEVLFLYDPWDEFVMDHLREFEGKPIRPAEKAELKIETPEAGAQSLTPEQGEVLAKWLKESLGDRVNEVRVSHRLVGSPAVVMDSDKYLTSSMRRILKSMNPDTAPPVKLDLEINPRHAIVFHLEKTRQNDSALAAKVAEQVFDNARVAAGLMEDPRTMLKRLNELLEQVLAAKT